jgi:uncharacterized protein (TIGR02118 family)
MVKHVVGYGKPDDPAAFDAYYEATHRPLAEKIPTMQRFEAGKVLGSPDGSEPPFYFLAELFFDDPGALQAAMATEEGQAAGADVANFASGGAQLFIAQV